MRPGFLGHLAEPCPGVNPEASFEDTFDSLIT